VLHLYDTYGLGIANLVAALQMGVRRFDCAFGGMGGCPFIEGAAGNIATEDVVNLLNALGIENGIDWHQIAAVSRFVESQVQHPFTGKLYRMN